VRNILPVCRSCPLDLQWRLITFLNLGYFVDSSTGTVYYELLSHACMIGLFALISLSVQADSSQSCYLRMALLSLPLLMQRCQLILHQYAVDAANTELPQCRREEVAFILRELLTLQIQPQVTEILFTLNQLEYVDQNSRTSSQLTTIPSNSIGWRRHLIHMFPVLCDCITINERDLRDLLREVLSAAASELGLKSTLQINQQHRNNKE